ncbi:MAG: M23 family metallopeptidase [bacterium]|nr:M23 family metallopeptidase [bacterium]
MPRKQITFIIIPPADGQVQEYKFASRLLWLGSFVLLGIVGALGYYALQFHTRVDQTLEIAALTEQNEQLVRSLDGTRRDLVHLEGQMDQLALQDQRLRDYHEMEPVRDEYGALGVGGNDDPEDLPMDYASLPARKRALLSDLSMRIDVLKREALYQRGSFAALEDTFRNNEANLRFIPAIWPVDRNKAWKSSDFGKRTDPFTGRIAMHSGIDIAGRTGLEVRATADGQVAFAYLAKDLGNVVVINHNPEVIDENGNVTYRPGILRTEYGHLSKILVKKGDHVSRNQVVGLMGNTGRSTGPHLHYAVRYQDRRRGGTRGYIDPQEYLLDNNNDDRASAFVASAAE